MYITLSYIFLEKSKRGHCTYKILNSQVLFDVERIQYREFWIFFISVISNLKLLPIGSDRESKEFKVFSERKKGTQLANKFGPFHPMYIYIYWRANIESTMPDFPWATLFSFFCWLLGLFFSKSYSLFFIFPISSE